MVLIVDEDNYVTVSSTNRKRCEPSEWKWSIGSDDQLVNKGTGGYVCFDDDSDSYYCGHDYARFQTLSHFDYPEEFA